MFSETLISLSQGQYADRVIPYYWSTSALDYVQATTGGSGVGTEVKVTNTVPVTISGTVPVSGGLTDTQLRAVAVPVSLATNTPDVIDRSARLLGHVTVDSAPMTAVTLAAETIKVIGTVNLSAGQSVSVGNFPASFSISNFPGTQPISAASLPLPAGAALEAGGNLATIALAEAAGNASLVQLTALNSTLLTDLLGAMLTELKINNSLLQSGLNVRDDLDGMRLDPYYIN